ncbi:hypothetical protein LXL04_035418 [Taraxacum kok-saghyz]
MDHDLVWNWKRELRRGKESATLEDLKIKMKDVILTSASDSWRWNKSSDGDFSVYSLRMLMIDKDDESVDHVFFQCDYAYCVWNWFCSWSGLMIVVPTDFASFIACANSLKSDVRRFKLLLLLGYSVLWLIWRERNERIFGKRIKKPMQIADDIQLFSFSWIKNGANLNSLCWIDWCFSPQRVCNL